jgi:hypothetical protein
MTPEQRAARERMQSAEAAHMEAVFARMATRAVARLEEDMTPLFARVLASAGEGGEMRLMGGTGQVLRRRQPVGRALSRLCELLHEYVPISYEAVEMPTEEEFPCNAMRSSTS